MAIEPLTAYAPLRIKRVSLEKNEQFRVAILRWCKQANELALARELLAEFDKGALRQEVNRMAKAAVCEISDLLVANGDLYRAAFDKVWGKERKYYEVFKHFGSWDGILNAAFSLNPTPFTARHASEIIRLYGGFVEEIPDKTLEKKKDDFRREWTYIRMPPVEFKSKNLLKHYIYYPLKWLYATQSGWTKPEPLIKGGRKRVDVAEGNPWVAKDNPQIKRPQGNRYVTDKVIGLRGGLALKFATEGATTRKIDNVFGLFVGATWSGTTADTIFFIDKFGREGLAKTVDPIFYLLPVAALVAAGHHTILEVALPLSGNRMSLPEGQPGTGIDYSIGAYRTLKPKKSNHAQLPHIDRILTEHEVSNTNDYALIYYNKNKPAGYYEFDKSHEPTKKVFELLASADDSLLQHFRGLPPYPTEKHIRELVELYNPYGGSVKEGHGWKTEEQAFGT